MAERARGTDPLSWGGGAGLAGVAAVAVQWWQENRCSETIERIAEQNAARMTELAGQNRAAIEDAATRCTAVVSDMQTSYAALLEQVVKVCGQ